MIKKAVPLVVTTAHRGVFFGIGVPSDAPTIRLTEARMCLQWSADVKGVLGLAATGPSSNCRVGPAVPAITLRDVTSVMEATPEATNKWATIIWK